MSIQIKSSLDTTQPYHIYFDIEAINNDTTGLNAPPNLAFTEIRNNPYLNAPENYFLSVVRFSLQSPSLPIFIPQVVLGQNNPNITIYTITLSYKTYDYQQNIIYTPKDLSQPLPNPPIDFQDLETAYYFMFSYQQVIEMFNIAFVACLAGLNALVIAGGDTLPSPNPPFFEFDPNALVAILDADKAGYDRALVNPIKIYMNSPAFNLFQNFPAIYYGNNVSNGKNYLFDIYNNNNTNILNLPTYDVLQSYQEGTSTGLWNPIMSIVFTTALLPVVPSYTSVPKVWGNDSKLFNIGNNANLAPVITDFIVPWSATNTYRDTIEYTPNGEYRLLDMFGSSPLSAVELSCFWKDQFGGLHPFKVNSGCSASIKLMFRRKDYNNSMLPAFSRF
jgi:hypothetical protein